MPLCADSIVRMMSGVMALFAHHRASQRHKQDVAFQYGLYGHTAANFLYAQNARGRLGNVVAPVSQERFNLIGPDTCELSGHIGNVFSWYDAPAGKVPERSGDSFHSDSNASIAEMPPG